MKTSNPVFSEKALERAASFTDSQPMTVQGTVNKTFVLLALLSAAAIFVWQKAMALVVPGQTLAYSTAVSSVGLYVMGGAIAGFVLGLITMFKTTWAKVTVPLYAVAEGLFLGGLSAIFELQYPGIVLNAVGLTFATLLCLLTAYRTGMVKVTDKFRAGIVAATGAICVVYLISWIASFFHAQIPGIFGHGAVGIGFSLVVVVIAALNLVLDFDFIERGAEQGMPQYMEWYGAFGLMVTLVWLYLEILRLLAKLRSRD
ncbi:MAG: Bax inhibitor-1/YccA family protein [Candidatus Omnitrophica bacterium]|nr:Bax inhibitor-1/YccA family protein [Candidatus Omnitrophota bacterium]